MGLNTQHLQSSKKPLASIRGNGLDLITVFTSDTASILEGKVIIDAQEGEMVAAFNTNWLFCCIISQQLWNGSFSAMQCWNFFKSFGFKTFSSKYSGCKKKCRCRCWPVFPVNHKYLNLIYKLSPLQISEINYILGLSENKHLLPT